MSVKVKLVIVAGLLAMWPALSACDQALAPSKRPTWSETRALPEEQFIQQTFRQLGERVVNVDKSEPRFRLIDPDLPGAEQALFMLKPRAPLGYRGLCALVFLHVRFGEASKAQAGDGPVSYVAEDLERIEKYRVVGNVGQIFDGPLRDRATDEKCTAINTSEAVLDTADVGLAWQAATLTKAIADGWKRGKAGMPIECHLVEGCEHLLDNLAAPQIGSASYCDHIAGVQRASDQTCTIMTVRGSARKYMTDITFEVFSRSSGDPDNSPNWQINKVVISRSMRAIE